ncbi:MAG TPA: TraC family protein, partial [Planctomycetota bacterium]|nr:TraC family protein [Planctomycetota bacterium]
MPTDTKRSTKVSRVDLVDRVKATDSVSNYLMATSYDDDAKIYTLADLSVGVLLEITPLPSSVLSDDELFTYSDAIATALSRLPEHAIVQSTVLPASNVDSDLQAYYHAGGDDHPVLATHERMVAEQFKRSVTKPLFAFQFGEGGFKTKRYRVLLSIVVRPDDLVGGAKASLFDFLTSFLPRSGSQSSVRMTPAEERYLAMKDRLYKTMQEAARRLEGTLSTNHLRVRRLSPTELVSFTRMLLWPDATVGMKITHDPFQQIAEQIPLGDIAVECATGSVMSDGWVYKTLSMSGIPRHTSPGTTTLPQANLGLFTLLDFIGDGFLTVSCHCKPLKDMRDFIKDRKKQLEGGFAMPQKVEQGVKDCDLASFYIENDRRRMFDTQLVIAVRAKSEREA